MNNPKYLKIINENEKCDYKVIEMFNKEFSREYMTLVFQLKNENEDNLIKNPYKEAVQLINIFCMYSILLVDGAEMQAYSFEKDYNFGERTEILIEDIGIERFTRKSLDILYKKNPYISFETFALEDRDLKKISKIESIKEVLNYLKNINCYKTPVKASIIEVSSTEEDCDLPF